jgi:uncharacterized protein YkwD
LIAVVLLVASGSPVAEGAGRGRSVDFTDLEKCFMTKINSRRAAHGKRPLTRDGQLGFVARNHSHQIANERTLRHDNNYTREITNWNRLGQNTGRGGSCRSLSQSFWSSSTHRSNILGRWRYVGVGVARANGKIYVQQVYEARRDPGNIY